MVLYLVFCMLVDSGLTRHALALGATEGNPAMSWMMGALPYYWGEVRTLVVLWCAWALWICRVKPRVWYPVIGTLLVGYTALNVRSIVLILSKIGA